MNAREILSSKRRPLNPPRYTPILADQSPRLVCIDTAVGGYGIKYCPTSDVSIARVRADGHARHYEIHQCVSSACFPGNTPEDISRQIPRTLHTSIDSHARIIYYGHPLDGGYNGAWYHVMHSILPSVTTILDNTIHTTDLDLWRERVGHEVADEIAAKAAAQGTIVHSLCDQYVTTGVNPINHQDETHTPMVATIFHLLRRHIESFDSIIASELPVWSITQGYAGTIDMIGVKDGRTILFDLKTYRAERTDDQLLKAKLQTTLYTLAVEEMYDVRIDEAQIVYANVETGLRVIPVDPSVHADHALNLASLHHHLTNHNDIISANWTHE